MKRLLAVVMLALLIAGCAATTYKNARLNANLVKNGMTLDQVSRILGMPPTHTGVEFAEWRRGDAQKYDGTINGAIRFEMRDGVTVNVPEGGIFSPAALARLNAEWLTARRKLEAEQELNDVEKQRQIAEAAARKARQDAENLERTKRQIADEILAKERSFITCTDKVMCSKVFALAQIFVAQRSDQKIQVATDTIIETYNPTEPNRIGMSIVKTPGKGTTEVVSVTPTCKGNDYDLDSLCRKRRTAIYNEFRSFIEARLQK